MAVVFADGLDCYGGTSDMIEAGWHLGGTYAWAAATGRFGGGSFRLFGNGYAYKLVTTSGDEVGIQFAYCDASLVDAGASPGDNLLVVYNNSATDQCFRMTLDQFGVLRLYNSPDALIATSDTDVIIQDQWHYIEVWAKINNGAGTIYVEVEGMQIFNEAAVDTAVADTDVDMVCFYGPGSGYYDDIMVLDGSGAQCNALLGDSRAYPATVDADTAQEDWDRSAGADSYALIDDTLPGDHDGDTTYIEDETVGNETRCEVADDIPATASTIHFVTLVTSMCKTDAGARTARGLINSNGTEDVGTTRSPTTTYQTYRDYYELDPDGSIAWTRAKVNALEIGAEIVA